MSEDITTELNFEPVNLPDDTILDDFPQIANHQSEIGVLDLPENVDVDGATIKISYIRSDSIRATQELQVSYPEETTLNHYVELTQKMATGEGLLQNPDDVTTKLAEITIKYNRTDDNQAIYQLQAEGYDPSDFEDDI